MRESFPTSATPGQRLSPAWVENVGQRLNNYGQFSAGSMLMGMRTYGVSADLARQSLYVRHFLIDKVVNPSNNQHVDKVNIDINPGISPSIEWRGKMWRFNSLTGTYLQDVATFPIRVDWLPEQFLVKSDHIWAMYDYIRGVFTVLSPPMVRMAKSQQTLRAAQTRLRVEILGGPDFFGVVEPEGTQVIVRAVVDAACKFKIAENDIVFITYVEPFSSWYVTTACGQVERKVHFRLNEAMAVNVAFSSAVIEFEYGRGTDYIGGNESIWNPPRGCGDGTYRFAAPAGARGQAISDPETGKLFCWQLDCC